MFLLRKNLLILFLSLALEVFCTPVSAKKVVIEWKPLEGAIQYQIKIQDGINLVLEKEVEEPYWKGDLPSGVYSYQIRAIDRAKRAGFWTPVNPLALMPPPPEPRFPPEGTQLKFYNSKLTTVLQWEPISGIQKYDLEISRDGKIVQNSVVLGTSLELKDLLDGKYRWKVRGRLEAQGSLPASLQGKKWETESKEGEFRVENKKLEAPVLLEPLGSLPPPEHERLNLRWKKVEGAAAYEVQLLKSSKRKSAQELESDLAQTRRFRTVENSMSSYLEEGTYLWGVRALANFDERKNPQASGPKSVGQFKLDRNAVFQEDLGYLALSTMIAPCNYRVLSPSNFIQGSTQAIALVGRVSGEYWFYPQWGISTAYEYAGFQINGYDFGRPSFELLGKFRTKLGSGFFGWSISPKIGFEGRAYNEVIPSFQSSGGGLTVFDVYTLGATIGLDIRKQFSKDFSLGAKFSYFYPLKLVGAASSGGTLSGDPSYRNFSVGIQALYWLNSKWGIGAGGFLDQRSISFTTSVAAGQEQIFMDAVYFFGSVVFRIWK